MEGLATFNIAVSIIASILAEIKDRKNISY